MNAWIVTDGVQRGRILEVALAKPTFSSYGAKLPVVVTVAGPDMLYRTSKVSIQVIKSGSDATLDAVAMSTTVDSYVLLETGLICKVKLTRSTPATLGDSMLFDVYIDTTAVPPIEPEFGIHPLSNTESTALKTAITAFLATPSTAQVRTILGMSGARKLTQLCRYGVPGGTAKLLRDATTGDPDTAYVADVEKWLLFIESLRAYVMDFQTTTIDWAPFTTAFDTSIDALNTAITGLGSQAPPPNEIEVPDNTGILAMSFELNVSLTAGVDALTKTSFTVGAAPN